MTAPINAVAIVAPISAGEEADAQIREHEAPYRRPIAISPACARLMTSISPRMMPSPKITSSKVAVVTPRSRIEIHEPLPPNPFSLCKPRSAPGTIRRMDALEKLRGSLSRIAKQSCARGPSTGDKVVGYFSNNVPTELILATGMFPVRLTGDPRGTTEIGDRYMEEFHDGEIRSIFDRMLRGHFNFCDLIVVPRTSESFLQLYYYLLEARRWEPARVIPRALSVRSLAGAGRNRRALRSRAAGTICGERWTGSRATP